MRSIGQQIANVVFTGLMVDDSMLVSLSCGMSVQQAMNTVLLHVSVAGVVVRLGRLHLDDKVATTCVDILRVKHTAVGLKTTTSLVPAAAVEGVEVVTPVELKLVEVLIVSEDLNVVVEYVPWHVDRVETLAPRVEGRSPEVHPQRLSLAHELDGLDV